MTKKHLIELADAIRDAKPIMEDYTEYIYTEKEYNIAMGAWEGTRNAVADFLQITRQQFQL